ncbi:MAG: protein translocase subunit SecF [candidate division Zixibacteria bacterium]|nr:protein translocase subunit SecF [candidate division Zixibacteria bacterium]
MPIRFIGETNIDFLGKRKASFVLSAILIIIGIVAAVMVSTGQANLGIEFIGGTMVEGYFENPVSTADLRTALSGGGFGEAEIQRLEGREEANTFLIRIKAEEGGGARKAQDIIAVLEENFPNNTFHMDSVHEVGPAVGETLQSQARWAVIVSLLGILVYITLRFDFRFGVAATIATFHDVLVVLGIFFLLNKEITLLVVSALLTLAGYSLTDTVVVYDRIRENLKKFHKKADFVPAVNRSINDVLSRTIMTSLTVLIVVGAIYIAGGPVLRDFALALIFGVLVGTYSSVFVASPVYVEWEARKPRRFKA